MFSMQGGFALLVRLSRDALGGFSPDRRRSRSRCFRKPAVCTRRTRCAGMRETLSPLLASDRSRFIPRRTSWVLSLKCPSGVRLTAADRKQMLKNLGDMAVGVLAYWALGWGFAYGEDNGNGFIGTSEFFGGGMKDIAGCEPLFVSEALVRFTPTASRRTVGLSSCLSRQLRLPLIPVLLRSA